jgi:hypothetical protein
MATGECNCGAVRYRIDLDLADVIQCHCSICRRATGSNGIAVVLAPADRFDWVAGEDHIATWHKPNSDWHIWFCRVCGSPVPGKNDPTRMFVPAGSLTQGGESLQVAHHVWVGSKAVWDEIGDAGIQHPEGIFT